MRRCSVEILACLSGTKSCSFKDAVRESFRLFPNVPEIREKQKKCLNLLFKRKDVLGLLPTRLGKSLILIMTNFLKLRVDRPNTTHELVTLELV